MPQMSPFNWMIMFLIFMTSFIFSLCKLFNFNSQIFNKNDSVTSSYSNEFPNKFWMW